MKKKTKSIVAIAMAAAIASSMATTTVSAFTPYYDVDTTPTYYQTASYTKNSKTYKIPQQIYMTCYNSGYGARIAKAQATVDAAVGLLGNITYDTLSVPAPTFNGIQLYFAPTKYDHLIKANAEGGATILTFNSEANLKSAMSKIKTEEQSIMNAALLPYRNYIDTLISNGAYTRVNQGDDDTVKAAKLSNAAILSAIKNALTYTYTDTDLFSGDVTGQAKTFQIAYLSEATVGNSSTQTVVSNDEEFTNFPRLVNGGVTLDWNAVHHLDIFNNSNNSWWFALKDGNTLNNDYYWLNGMMIPDFGDTISFDAYANTYWAQYGAATTGGNTNPSPTDPSYDRAYYYNTSFNYVSDNTYAVTDGYNTYYYPNIAYAKAAIAANPGSYIANITKSTHSEYARYFCFLNGFYYGNANTSAYPSDTIWMSDNNSTTTVKPIVDTSINYYVHEGNVYSSTGSLIGNAASRGYSRNNTWFCTSDGMFYAGPQNGKSGYYVTLNDGYNIDMSDPSYQYWMYQIMALRQQIAAMEKNDNTNSKPAEKPATSSSTSSSSSSTKEEIIIADNDTGIITATELAALRANGETIEFDSNHKAVKWTIAGENVKTAKDTNLRVTFGQDNIPEVLRKAVMTDVAASSRVTIGENVRWGINASVTIKYKAERANFIAKMYRYDTSTSTLILVNTATVGNNGYVTFNNIDRGGDYLITLQ